MGSIEHIKEIVNVQQSLAKPGGLIQAIDPRQLVKESLFATKATLLKHGIKLEKRIDDSVPLISTDKHKILQILINFIENGKQAAAETCFEEPTLWFEVVKVDDRVLFRITDNGVGIAPENLDKIFQHGFTTKKNGHGFGLHCSANAAQELGGQLRVFSDGLGKGATFELELPISQNKPTPACAMV